MPIDETLFDSRVVDRNIRKGLITREDHDKYLAGLNDVEDRAVAVEAEFEVGVLGDDDSTEEE